MDNTSDTYQKYVSREETMADFGKNIDQINQKRTGYVSQLGAAMQNDSASDDEPNFSSEA